MYYIHIKDLACIFVNGYGRRVFDIQNAKPAKNAKVFNLVNGKILQCMK
jgi:hypothetical protein